MPDVTIAARHVQSQVDPRNSLVADFAHMLAAYKSFGENLEKIIVEVDDVIVRIDNEHQEWNHLAKKLTETTDGLVINGTCQLEEDSNWIQLEESFGDMLKASSSNKRLLDSVVRKA